MEGLMTYFPFWVGYLVFAALGVWCWNGLFFWLPKHSDVRRFVHMLGAVLLFPPAPVSPGSGFFAPAFVVFPFTILGSSLDDAMYVVGWFLGGLCAGVLVLAVRQLLHYLSQKENDR